MSTKRIEFVKECEKLIQLAGEDVTIEYGSFDILRHKFVKESVDINTNPNKREVVLIKYKGQSEDFGIVQPIEMDGYFWILKDIIKGMERL